MMDIASPERRVLFVGECHALVMREIFSRFCLTAAMFDVIKPEQEGDRKALLAKAAQYHAVVFIHAHYNDDDACRDALRNGSIESGYQFLTVPPISWQGYHPTLIQTRSLGWCYKTILELQETCADVATFVEHSLAIAIDPAEANAHLDRCNARLRDFEHANGCTVRLADFIERECRSRRLFLMPTHGSNALYVHLCHALADALGLDISSDIDTIQSEIQPDAFLPILPSVSRALGLRFCANEYVMHFATGLRTFSWREWLELLFNARPGACYLSPGWGAPVERIDDGRNIPVVRNQVVYALADGDAFVVLDSSPSLRSALPAGTRIRLAGESWEVRPIEGYGLD